MNDEEKIEEALKEIKKLIEHYKKGDKKIVWS